MFYLPKELEELKSLRHWVCYKLEPRPTRADPDHLGKVPYNPITDKGAKANDPRSWVDYETALHAVESGRYNGLGFELGGAGYCGIDIDHCVTDGQISPAAQHIIDQIGSYTEYSISGTGIHIIAKSAPLDRAGYNDPKENGIDLEVYRPVEKRGGSFSGEIEGGRYLTVSGRIYGEGEPIADRTAEVKSLVNYYWPKKEAPEPTAFPSVESADVETDRKILQAALDSIDAADLDFDQWASIVSAMKACGFSPTEAEAWSGRGGNPKHVSGYIYKRWQKFHLPNRDDYRAGGVIVNIAKEYGFNIADAFTEEERRQYGRELHRKELKKYTSKFNGSGQDPDSKQAEPAPDREGVQQEREQKTAKSFLDQFTEDIQTEKYKPYETGLSFFDSLLGGGVLRQTLLVLMAAPGTGKTTLCQQLGESMAMHGKQVVYINLEMSADQMTAKSISALTTKAGVKMSALDVLQGYRWGEAERKAVRNAIQTYREKIAGNLEYNPDSVGKDIDQIRDYLQKVGKKAKQEGNEAPCIILDYLHLVTGKPGIDSQTLIKDIMYVLKRYAIDYDTVCIAIAAVNRDGIKGQIDQTSGRDSSNIEYGADYQLALDYYALDRKEKKNIKEYLEALENEEGKPCERNVGEQIAALQRMEWRHMILRVLKGRLCLPGKSARLYFHALSSTFYGEYDWMPVDPAREPFPGDVGSRGLSFDDIEMDGKTKAPRKRGKRNSGVIEYI